MKTDQSIKGIVVAAIRRHSMDIDTWIHTRLWESGDPVLKNDLSHVCEFVEGELPILYSYINPPNWTLVTTRHIWYSEERQVNSVVASDIRNHSAGNFKGYGKKVAEKMVITTQAGSIHYCPFETGRPSMGIIYAIMTLCQLLPDA